MRLGSRTGFNTVCELLKVMIPVMLVMIGAEAANVLPWLAKLFKPVMGLLGLPGNAALVFISGAAVNLYTAVAVAASVPLTAKQITILALLCLDCHNLPVECAVQKKAGAGVISMVTIRLLTGLVGAFVFSWLIPDTGRWAEPATRFTPAKIVAEAERLGEFLMRRLVDSAWCLVQVVLIVMALMILVELLRQTGVLKALTWLMRPLVWVAGLPREAAFMVMASSTLGLAFGAGLVIAEARQGHLSEKGQFRTNVFIGTTHSLFEDTALFVVLGASVWWIVLGRVVLGALAVRVFALFRGLFLRLQGPSAPAPAD